MSTSIDVAECFKLHHNGGPEHESTRGVTLHMANLHLHTIFRQLSDIDRLIKSQEALCERSLKCYGLGTVGYNQDKRMLATLNSIRDRAGGLSKQELAIEVFKAVVSFKEQ